MSFNLASKSVFVTRLVISGILFSTAVNAELLARPLMLGILPSTSVILELKSTLSTELVTLGILFSTAVNAEVVHKPVISGILFSTAARADFLTKLLTSGIFFSTLLILSSKSDPSFSYLVLETKFVVSIPFTLLTNLSLTNQSFLQHHF